mmetsp:Transcript_12193/g.21583  ORF Transcript_12193/g.21583 Transcript_12193/m.21583 type:complete len:168 (-) Transcript_12193:173-676(-)
MGSKSWSQMVWEAMYMLSYGGTSDDKQGYHRCGRLPFTSTVTTQLKEAPSVWDEFIGTYPHMEHLTQDGLLQELKHKCLCIQIEEQQLTEQLLQIGLVHNYWVHYYEGLGKYPFIKAHLDAARTLQAEMEQNMAKLKDRKAELRCSLKQLMPTKQQEQYKEHSPAQH